MKRSQNMGVIENAKNQIYYQPLSKTQTEQL